MSTTDEDSIQAEKEAAEVAQKIIELLDTVEAKHSVQIIALAMVSATLLKVFEVITEGKADLSGCYTRYGDLVGSYLGSMKAISFKDSGVSH